MKYPVYKTETICRRPYDRLIVCEASKLHLKSTQRQISETSHILTPQLRGKASEPRQRW